MCRFFFKLLLLVTVLAISSSVTFSQFNWTKYPNNPLSIHGSSGSWDRSLVTPYVLFNSDLNRYEMWYGSFDGTYPNAGIGFAYSSDGITWSKHPTPVMTPSGTGWDAVSVGECSVIKEGNVYKMWYTGHPNSTRTPSYIGYATSPDGINWTKHSGNPVLSPGSGWESARVEFPSVIKVTGGYWMFYTGEISHGIARTGRAFSSDGITWQRDLVNNPVLQPGGSGAWDQNNYLGIVIEFNNTLYIYYTGETNPGVSGTAIGVAASTDMGITWTKYSGNPIIQRGTSGQWDNGWIETGSVLLKDNTFKMWYDGGGSATSFLGRIGYATSPTVLQNWQIQTSNFPADVMVINFSAVDNQTCWAVGQKNPPNSSPYSGYLRTTDGGTNWTLNTIPGITNGYLAEIFAVDANTAYATSYKLVGTTGTIGIYKTTDGGMTWNRQNAYNSSQTGAGYIYFFDSQNGLAIGDYLETYTTTNGGTNWNPVTMPPPLTDEWTWLGESRFTVSGNNIWFCTNKGRMFKSTDKGYTWTIILSELQYSDWRPSVAFQNSQIGIYALKIAGSATDHIVRKTTDGGTTWSTITNSVLANLTPSTIQHVPGTTSTYILTAGRDATMKGTAVTYDAGESWTLLDTVGCFILNFASYNGGWGSQWGTNVVYKYVGPPLPVELTSFTISTIGTEVILNWSTATELNNYGFEIQRKVLSGEFATVAFVKGQGTTTQQNQYSFADKNLDEGKYFYRLKQMDYGGQFSYSQTVEVDVRMLNKYSLEQNYPNPFNPSTRIKYQVSSNSHVSLVVYDILGNEIKTLVNEEKPAGTYEVTWYAENLPSGVYFYQLLVSALQSKDGKAGSFVETKKMILLR